CVFILFIFSVLLLFTYVRWFFFQAEDGIRYRNVTGVQTCALPDLLEQFDQDNLNLQYRLLHSHQFVLKLFESMFHPSQEQLPSRSEERRVGKECSSPKTQRHLNKKNIYTEW